MNGPRQCILIMTDSTRYDMLGCYGNADMLTPNLDRMARAGTRFERAYTCQPVCGPARSALFTGLFPHSNASWGNTMPLGADVKTIGQRLSSAGVKCAYIGKWHLDGGDYFGNGECPDGWDAEYWYDMRTYLEELTPEERRASRDSKLKDVDEKFTYGYRATERALKFLREHSNEDFLLVLSYDEPHDPGLCPEPYASMYNDYEFPKTPAHFDTLEGKPELQKLWGARGLKLDRHSVRVMNPKHLGCNSYIDSQIGRVLDAITARAPGALTIYTSDHGDAMHAHCLYAKGPCVYDEIARVPLICMGGGAAEGFVYEHTVSHIDLPATIIDYMGLARPAMLEGRSLLDNFYGDPAPTGRPAFVEFGRYEIDHDGFGGFQPMRAIITDEYKLSINLLDTDEMYDIARDPHNVRNVINEPEYAVARDALHDALINFMNETRDPFRGYQWQARPWRADKRPSWDVDGYTRQRVSDPGEIVQLDYQTGLDIKEATRPKG